MDYSLIIENRHASIRYVNGLKTWKEVTNFLKNNLEQWVISVTICKYSSDNKNLGEKCVTMGNLIEVATSETDKILKQ